MSLLKRICKMLCPEITGELDEDIENNLSAIIVCGIMYFLMGKNELYCI